MSVWHWNWEVASWSFNICHSLYNQWGFPGSSAGKESTCNAGDPSSVPESGRSPGEGIGYPFQYPWASLMAQLVKNPPAMWKTWFWSLGWEDPLEKGMATHSSILAWRISWTVQAMGLQRVGHDWVTFTFTLYSQWLVVRPFKPFRVKYPIDNMTWMSPWHLTLFLSGFPPVAQQ